MAKDILYNPVQKQHLYDRLTFDQDTLIDLCHRWQIQEFALFGSVLREDFRPDSDIDVLLTFLPNDPWNLFDIIDLKHELESLTNRSVDLTQKNLLRNPYRRAEILKTYQVLYEIS
jgi:predicted nucleotidyltransferase